MPKKIILDCDPGVDDAWAIVLACGDPELELCGITTVAGNAGLAETTANALRVCEFIGADIPVAAGSPVSLQGGALGSGDVHGAGGLGEARLPEPVTRPLDVHAADFLVETISAAPGEITLVATGPLTNIAHAVRRHPELAAEVKDFVIMGGSAGRGNVTPAAEFNIAADPQAAELVFTAGWTVAMVGLDVTLRAQATAEMVDRLRALGPLADDLLLPALAGYLDDQDVEDGLGPATDPGTELATDQGTGRQRPATGAGGRPMHDLCAVARVSLPGLFGCRPARVQVETAGRWTTGMTVTDFRVPRAESNASVAVTVDTQALWNLVLASYARVAAAMASQGRHDARRTA